MSFVPGGIKADALRVFRLVSGGALPRRLPSRAFRDEAEAEGAMLPEEDRRQAGDEPQEG